MNKLILILTMLFAVHIVSAQSTTTTQVSIAIELGGPKINGVCRGNDGICGSIGSQNARYTNDNWDCKGEVFLDAHNSLIMTIDKSTTSPFAREIQFRDGYMDVHVPWELSNDILDQIKPNRGSSVIPPGKYIIIEFKNSYVINFGNFLM